LLLAELKDDKTNAILVSVNQDSSEKNEIPKLPISEFITPTEEI